MNHDSKRMVVSEPFFFLVLLLGFPVFCMDLDGAVCPAFNYSTIETISFHCSLQSYKEGFEAPRNSLDLSSPDVASLAICSLYR